MHRASGVQASGTKHARVIVGLLRKKKGRPLFQARKLLGGLTGFLPPYDTSHLYPSTCVIGAEQQAGHVFLPFLLCKVATCNTGLSIAGTVGNVTCVYAGP